MAKLLGDKAELERYRVESLLGEGGMARVYRVQHSTLKTVFALKVLTVASRTVRERLLKEGQAQASLKHPNIVAVTDVLDIAGNPGLVMEYVDGPSLEQVVRSELLPLEAVDAIGRDLMAGVAAAHKAGLVHRDLKPGNVMLDLGHGTVTAKVTDFGIAKFSAGDDGEGPKTRTGIAMGTPQYMAPEQIRDAKNVGPKADVWAVGAILYELCTGRRAFDGPDMLSIFNKVATGEFLEPHSLRTDMPARMRKAIEAALVKDEAARVGSMAELSEIWCSQTTKPMVEWGSIRERCYKLVNAEKDKLPALPKSEALPTFFGMQSTEPVPAKAGFRPGMWLGLGGGAVGLLSLLAVVMLLLVVGLWWVAGPTLNEGATLIGAADTQPAADGEDLGEANGDGLADAAVEPAVEPKADRVPNPDKPTKDVVATPKPVPVKGEPAAGSVKPEPSTEPAKVDVVAPEPTTTSPPVEPKDEGKDNDGLAVIEPPSPAPAPVPKSSQTNPGGLSVPITSGPFDRGNGDASSRAAAVDALPLTVLNYAVLGRVLNHDGDILVRGKAFGRLRDAAQGNPTRAFGVLSACKLTSSQWTSLLPSAGKAGESRFVLKGAKQRDYVVRLAAIPALLSLARGGDKNAVAKLKDLQNDNNSKVAKEAKKASGKI